MRSWWHARAAMRLLTWRGERCGRDSKETFDHAAVHLDRSAGHIGGGVRQQEGANTAELRRVAVTSERHGPLRTLLLFLERDAGFLRVDLVELLKTVGRDAAGNERVDANLVGRELD